LEEGRRHMLRKMRKSKRLILPFISMLGIIICIVLFSSIWLGTGFASEKFTIYVVNYPLQYFAERIAGDHAVVVLPVPSDVDPSYWRPEAKTVVKFQ
jgi:ABC-type Zn uptake system ZnuABC Zn-binding protein ZnuA